MLKSGKDDLFDGGPSMTFGEHLEELRQALFKSLYGLVIAMLVGFFFATQVVIFFQRPLERALRKFEIAKRQKELREKYGADPPVELINTITNGVVPETISLDPHEVFTSLRSNFPRVGEEFTNFSVAFEADDFVNSDLFGVKRPSFVLLSKQIKERGASESPTIEKSIWDFLSAAERESLSTLAAQSESSVTVEQKAQMVALFNRLLETADLEKFEKWNAVSPRDEPTRNTIEQLRKSISEGKDTGKSSEHELRRFRRLLLTNYFQSGLRPPTVRFLVLTNWKPVNVSIQSLSAEEPFMIWLKASLLISLVLASPWIFYQIWNFVAAGLYPHEKQYVHIYLPLSLGLFFGGAALAFLFVFDPVLDFLFSFNAMMNIDPDPRIGEWLGFVLLMPIGFGVSFQLPLVMLFLNRIGLVEVATYIEHWRVAVLVIFIVAMILTPSPDPYSMLLMAIPLCGLYVLGLGLCKWAPQGRGLFSHVYEP